MTNALSVVDPMESSKVIAYNLTILRDLETSMYYYNFLIVRSELSSTFHFPASFSIFRWIPCRLTFNASTLVSSCLSLPWRPMTVCATERCQLYLETMQQQQVPIIRYIGSWLFAQWVRTNLHLGKYVIARHWVIVFFFAYLFYSSLCLFVLFNPLFVILAYF